MADILGREAPEPPDPPDDFEGGGGSFGGISIPFPLLLILAALLVAVSAVAARSMGRRSVLDWEAKGGRGGDEERTPASDLGKQADDAERRGDFATAVRLRFQAGLVRLHELGSIELRPSLTATGAARESGIGAIAGLARTYERVAFGGREASADDASFQRSEWADIVAEARRKR